MPLWVRLLCALADWLSREVWDRPHEDVELLTIRTGLYQTAVERIDVGYGKMVYVDGWHPIRLL